MLGDLWPIFLGFGLYLLYLIRLLGDITTLTRILRAQQLRYSLREWALRKQRTRYAAFHRYVRRKFARLGQRKPPRSET